MSWAYEKVVLAETVTMPFVSVREDFLYQHSTTSSLQDEVVECWYKKSSPGSSKKTAMARDKLLTFVAPSNPHFKVATEKGWTHRTWMAVFSEGRRRQPERNNFEVGGHGGSHAWIYCSIGWLFFLKNPVSISITSPTSDHSVVHLRIDGSLKLTEVKRRVMLLILTSTFKNNITTYWCVFVITYHFYILGMIPIHDPDMIRIHHDTYMIWWYGYEIICTHFMICFTCLLTPGWRPFSQSMHPVSGNHNRLSWFPSCLSRSTMPGLTTTEYLTIAQPGLLECKDSSTNQIFSAWSSQCFSLELMHLVWELYIYISILWAFNLCVWYHVLDSIFFLNINQQPLSFFPKPGLQGMTAGGLAGRDFLSFFCPEERRTAADSRDPKRCQRGYSRKCMYVWYTYLPLDLHQIYQIYIKYIEYMASKTLERN